MLKRCIWPLLFLLLTACAASQVTKKVDSGAMVVSPVVDAQALAELRNAAVALPGAEVGADEPLTIRYPGQVIFSKGAALPLAGVGVLDPLVAFLVGHSASRWQGTVRAASGVSPEYDQQLAQKRAELLGRYFESRGLSADRLTLKAASGSGPAFELARQD